MAQSQASQYNYWQGLKYDFFWALLRSPRSHFGAIGRILSWDDQGCASALAVAWLSRGHDDQPDGRRVILGSFVCVDVPCPCLDHRPNNAQGRVTFVSARFLAEDDLHLHYTSTLALGPII